MKELFFQVENIDHQAGDDDANYARSGADEEEF